MFPTVAGARARLLTRRLTLICTATIIATLAGPRSLAHAAGPARTLESLSVTASLIFAGTVDSVTYCQLGQTAGTVVHFSSLDFAKGRSTDDTLSLTLWGGKWGGLVYVQSESPVFSVGRRYIVFTAGKGSAADWYMPIVGMGFGYFVVQRDSAGARSVMTDSEGNPIVRIEGRHLVLVSKRKPAEPTSPPSSGRESIEGVGLGSPARREVALEFYAADADPGTRVSERELLAVAKRLSQGRER